MGAAGIFGWWILACCISLLVGGFVTNTITNKIISLPRPKEVISNESQSGAVVASLFGLNSKLKRNTLFHRPNKAFSTLNSSVPYGSSDEPLHLTILNAVTSP